MEAWLKKLKAGDPLYDADLCLYHSDDDPQEYVGARVALPFTAEKGKPGSGEVWYVRMCHKRVLGFVCVWGGGVLVFVGAAFLQASWGGVRAPVRAPHPASVFPCAPA